MPSRRQKPSDASPAERMVAGKAAIGTEAPEHHDGMIVAFAHLAKALLPLAAQLASDDFSAEERDRLRTLAGDFTIFNLKIILVQLCGEGARELTRSEES